jgi:hypothetical protein
VKTPSSNPGVDGVRVGVGNGVETIGVVSKGIAVSVGAGVALRGGTVETKVAVDVTVAVEIAVEVAVDVANAVEVAVVIAPDVAPGVVTGACPIVINAACGSVLWLV